MDAHYRCRAPRTAGARCLWRTPPQCRCFAAAAAADRPQQQGQRRRQRPERQQSKQQETGIALKRSPGNRRSRNGTGEGAAAAATASAAPAPPRLPDTQLLRWERDGFTVTRGCLPAAEVEALVPEVEAIVEARKLDALRHRVRVLVPGADPSRVSTPSEALSLISRRGTDRVGFLQFFHLHRASAAVRALACGPALAGVAAQLLGARRVRLLQDAVFLKEPGFDETNWHSDLRMTPLDTNQYVTAWVPLRAVAGDERDSGLTFAAGSHRDFALPFWHDLRELGDLEGRGYRVAGTGPMAVGDVSWHHGWTLHCAGAQPKGSPPRLALAISYFADGARLLDAKGDASLRREMLHDEDAEGHGEWLAQLKGGAPARHALLPLVWDGRGPPRAGGEGVAAALGRK